MCIYIHTILTHVSNQRFNLSCITFFLLKYILNSIKHFKEEKSKQNQHYYFLLSQILILDIKDLICKSNIETL